MAAHAVNKDRDDGNRMCEKRNKREFEVMPKDLERKRQPSIRDCVFSGKINTVQPIWKINDYLVFCLNI